MSFADLIAAIGLILAVGIVGAAIVWALLETRREGVHHARHSLRQRHKSREKRLKAQDR